MLSPEWWMGEWDLILPWPPSAAPPAQVSSLAHACWLWKYCKLAGFERFAAGYDGSTYAIATGMSSASFVPFGAPDRTRTLSLGTRTLSFFRHMPAPLSSAGVDEASSKSYSTRSSAIFMWFPARAIACAVAPAYRARPISGSAFGVRAGVARLHEPEKVVERPALPWQL